ncbi:MAG TPA: metallophosphoesterase family protein [Acidimicrobiia bacterium]|nr:metallophosphoesterase family protein [Acidimicrobiia bacterium]
MPEVRNAEVMTVGPDEVVVTFATDDSEGVVTRVGDIDVTTTGPYHVARATGLEPATTYRVEVEGVAPDEYLPAEVQTLERPPGRLLATIATANDVHFGETECGRLGNALEEELGPVFSSEPGEPPYPETMNRAVIAEMTALDPDAVVVKGDLTDVGTADQYQAFLDAYGALGERMYHVRGNHDAMTDPTIAAADAPFEIALNGATLAVLDTVIPGLERGQITHHQLSWLDELAVEATGPVMVFGHHHMWNLDADHRSDSYFGINPDDSEALAAVVARRENIVGYFAGHTHRCRLRRFPEARNVPFCEIACTKDYPGAWAEYGVYEGGYTQIVRRAAAPEAMVWTEKTRTMFAGLYREYALGELDHRCFTERF